MGVALRVGCGYWQSRGQLGVGMAALWQGRWLDRAHVWPMGLWARGVVVPMSTAGTRGLEGAMLNHGTAAVQLCAGSVTFTFFIHAFLGLIKGRA